MEVALNVVQVADHRFDRLGSKDAFQKALHFPHADLGLDDGKPRRPAGGNHIGIRRIPHMLTDFVQIRHGGAGLEEQHPITVGIKTAALDHVEQIVFLVDGDAVMAGLFHPGSAAGGLEGSVDADAEISSGLALASKSGPEP